MDAEYVRLELQKAGRQRVGVNRHTIAGMQTLDANTAMIKHLTVAASNAGIPKTEVAKLLGMSTTRLYDLLAKPTVTVDAADADRELRRQHLARQIAVEVRRLAREARTIDQREVSAMLESAASKLSG
jgi:ribosome recycling factor